MASTDAQMKTFFQSSNFAVVGASTNTEKFGYKVFKWYVQRDLPATPVNPTAPAISVDGVDYKAVKSLSQLTNPSDTSVSIITAPPITIKTLIEAKELGVPAVWLQPGTFDDEVLKYAYANFKAVLAGDGGHGREGWCILVDGDRGLKLAEKL